MFKFIKGNIDVSGEDMTVLQDYIAYLIHEIRTPLNSIYGNLSMFQLEGCKEGKYIDDALLSAEYLLRLSDSIMDISKIKNDTSVIKTKAVTLDELLKYPKGIFEQTAARKKIELQFIMGKPAYQYLYLDREAVLQIIINLISNAIKYTNDGGKVVCRVSEEYLEEKRIRLLLEVADTGIGMETDFASCVWDEFSREGRKDDAWGSGLGMALVRRLVDFLGGRIRLKTRAGYGTRVLVELEADGDDVCHFFDRHIKEEGMNVQNRRNSSKDISLKRALVAEDEGANMELICKYLGKLGIEADRTYDGDEVIDFFMKSEENRYDVILMDINLPGKSGIEAVRTIRSLDRADSGLPIIAITADALGRHKMDVISDEINGYVFKPYRFEDIRIALSEAQEP